MFKSGIHRTLLNRDAFLSTLWSTLQQIVVALSTYFILQAIRCATNNEIEASLTYLIAFAVSLVAVYIPNTLSLVYLQFWRITSTDAFIQSFMDKRYGTTSMAHEREKSKNEAWLTNETFKVYEAITNLLYDIFSTSTNAVFNILVVALALDIRILFWYLVAGALLVVSHYLFRGKLAAVALAVQDNRKNMSSSMLAAWENILVGNVYNFSKWKVGYTRNVDEAKTVAAKYDLTRSLISSGTVSLALVVIAIGNAVFLLENTDNLASFASLMITMPRQLQVIQSTFSFFNYSLSWSGTYQQLVELENKLLSPRSEDSTKYIQFENINLQVPNLTALLNELHQRSSGRITIRGPNGSGKSTLLTYLKETFKDKAFYLPSNYTNLHFSKDFLNHSDGNRLLTIFQEISEVDGIQYLLLDEWDANLDEKNLMAVDSAIQDLAKKIVILETRHRS